MKDSMKRLYLIVVLISGFCMVYFGILDILNDQYREMPSCRVEFEYMENDENMKYYFSSAIVFVYSMYHVFLDDLRLILFKRK